ncbi:hypothetical protein [Streptomyces sp. NPDC057909]|uniref:hypothetical protein n=1 Tax=Streptomyces sp. NPDC057909 TaxID=3346277 RepID=UPI0036EE44D6
MRRQGRVVKAAQWPAVWAAVTVVMSFVTRLADIYAGWMLTAVMSLVVVAPLYWAPRRQARRLRKVTTRKSGGRLGAP